MYCLCEEADRFAPSSGTIVDAQPEPRSRRTTPAARSWFDCCGQAHPRGTGVLNYVASPDVSLHPVPGEQQRPGIALDVGFGVIDGVVDERGLVGKTERCVELGCSVGIGEAR
jgi:hypothetical protein